MANFIERFKFACKAVLPLVFDDSLSYYEVLCKIQSKINEIILAINEGQTGNAYVLPTATESTLGGVKAKARTTETTKVAVDDDGTLYVQDTSKDIPVATNDTLGGIKAKARTKETQECAIGDDGKLYAPAVDNIPIATATKAGGIKAGTVSDTITYPKEVAVDSETGKAYSEYPVAAGSNRLGLVTAEPATSEYTEDVRIGTGGRLYVKPGAVKAATIDTIGGGKAVPRSDLGLRSYTVGIDEDGQLYSKMPDLANTVTAGVVKAKPRTNESQECAIGDDGRLYAPGVDNIPIATETRAGGIKAGAVSDVLVNPKEVAVDSETGKAYSEYPVAAGSTRLGLVTAEPVTSEYTEEVRIGNGGRLYTKPSAVKAATIDTIGGGKAIPFSELGLNVSAVAIDPEGNFYSKLPDKATSAKLGSVKADPKTDNDTVPCRIGTDGKLYVSSIGGGSSGNLVEIIAPTFANYDEFMEAYNTAVSNGKTVYFIKDGIPYYHYKTTSLQIIFYSAIPTGSGRGYANAPYIEYTYVSVSTPEASTVSVTSNQDRLYGTTAPSEATLVGGGAAWGVGYDGTTEARWYTLSEIPCLNENTLITMADGTQKKVSEISSGDSVLSYNVATGEKTTATVINAYVTGYTRDWDIHYFDNGAYLVTYGLHGIYNKKLGHNSDIRYIDSEFVAVTETGESAFLEHDRVCTVGTEKRYNLVTSNCLYYANGILLGHHPYQKYAACPESLKSSIDGDVITAWKDEYDAYYNSMREKMSPEYAQYVVNKHKGDKTPFKLTGENERRRIQMEMSLEKAEKMKNKIEKAISKIKENKGK